MRIPFKVIQFELVVVDILKHYGFTATLCDDDPLHEFDISANYNDVNFAIELKFSRSITVKQRYLFECIERHIKVLESKSSNHIPVLIIGAVVSNELRKLVSEYYKGAILCDIENLLYMCGTDEELKTRLIALLDYSVETLNPIKPDVRLSMYSNTSDDKCYLADKLRSKLRKIEPGTGDSRKYEKWCIDVLKYLFSKNLSLWKEQETSNENLFRFDLICKIKNDNTDEFWQVAEKYFNTKYIIFEFKNYTGEISQKEIFTTEKYLYETALRKIAIIVSRKGIDNNAQKAINGILRESGKLIISINDNDIVEMLNGERQTPSELLSDKLDDLLVTLDK